MNKQLEETKESLADLREQWNQGYVKNMDYALDYADELINLVEETVKRNKELEYASKYNGELNEFLQKRKLPPNTLGRHVVDVVMERVEELEGLRRRNLTKLGELADVINDSREEKERYKQALKQVRHQITKPYPIKGANSLFALQVIDEALAGEPNET